MIVWDENDWQAGLMQGVGTAGLPALKGNVGSRTLTAIDPYRNYGYLSPGSFPVEATNSSELAGPIIAGAISSADSNIIYGIDAGGKIQKLTYNTNTLTTSFHTIAGTTPIGQDCLIYRHNSGGVQVNSLFYSYYQTVNWNVGAYISFSSFSDTYMSTTPATPLDIATASPADGKSTDQRTQPHPLCIGADDILYIGSGRYLHAYDGATGADGTFSSRVLTLPAGFQIIGIIKYNDLLLIAGNYTNSGEALIYVWNYIDVDTTQVIPLKDPIVSSLFIWRGEPNAITYGSLESRGQIRLKRIVGNTAVKITDFNQSVPPVFRGVDSTGQTLHVNCGGNIVTVGDVLSDVGYKVNNITNLVVAGVSGWFKIIPDVNLTYIASASFSTTYKLSKFIPRSDTNYTTAIYRSGYVEPLFPIGMIGRVKSVMAFFKSPVTNEASKNHAIILDTDYSNASTNVIIQTSLSSPLVKRYFVNNTGGVLPTFISISLDMVWQNGGVSAWVDYAVVSKVIVEFEDIAIDPNS